ATARARGRPRDFGGGGLARAAPCRPKVDEHRNARRAHDLVVLGRADVERLGRRAERLRTGAAASGVGEPSRGKPVRAAGMAAPPDHRSVRLRMTWRRSCGSAFSAKPNCRASLRMRSL